MAEVVEKLSRDDIIQQYHRNLVLYKGELIFVRDVDVASRCSITHIATGKQSAVPFSLENFKAPVFRLGMINICNSVLHLSRIPVRRMNIGINCENLVIRTLPVHYPKDIYDTIDKARSLVDKAFADVFSNTYPSLAEALAQAREHKSACAFDRQFAVDNLGNVFYKIQKVGTATVSTNVKDIVFNPEFLHLSILLEGNHEKTIGISCS